MPGRSRSWARRQHRNGRLSRRAPWIVTGPLSGIEGSSTEILSRLGLFDVVPALSFTGDVVIALELLRTTDLLTVLPKSQFALAPAMTGVRQLHLNRKLPPRNIALWVSRANRDRPEIVHCSDLLVGYFCGVAGDSTSNVDE